MAKKKVIKKVKVRKRKWFEVALPELFGGEVFTESLAESPEDLVGKRITISLGDVLKSASRKHISLRLKIDEIKTSTAHTSVDKLEVSAPYLLRKTRRNSKVSVKAVGKTKDEKTIDLRLCAIAKGHALTTAKSEIRKRLLNFASDVIANNKLDRIITDSINGTLFFPIKKELHKIHPIKSIELEKLAVKP